MVTSEAQEIKKQETLVRFSIVSYKTRLRVCTPISLRCMKSLVLVEKMADKCKIMHYGCTTRDKICAPKTTTEIFQIPYSFYSQSAKKYLGNI